MKRKISRSARKRGHPRFRARSPHGAADSIVTVGLTQVACGADPDDNLSRQIGWLYRAREQGARILCTQELFRSRYFPQAEDHRYFELAETIPGRSTTELCRLARQWKVVIIASIFEKRAPGLYHNTAVIMDADGSILGVYRKMHIPDDPLYYEKFYFTPGDTGFKTWRTAYGPVGVMVCWDQWFPEAARLTALQGAQILLYPTAIGWHPSERAKYGQAQREAWELMHRAHAVANGCFVCAPNRVGFERLIDAPRASGDGIEFWGGSIVVGPDGQVLARGSTEKEEVLVVPCDLRRVEFSRTHWPFLRDRRIDAYGELTRRFVDERE